MSRLNKTEEIIELAMMFQNSYCGLCIDDIKEHFECSRRSAERMKALLFDLFPEKIEEVQTSDKKKRWRFIKGTMNSLISFSADDFANPNEIKLCEIGIDDGFMGLDIGPKTVELYKETLTDAKVIFWNGPMGVFEDTRFANGTKSICAYIASLKDAFSVIGGGDSAAASKEFGYKDDFSHVSTGGGASLEMIENNGVLPGIEIIEDK